MKMINAVVLEKELNSLSEDKLKAVKSDKKFLRIIAGAGAGKTTTLAMKIIYLLSKGTKPEEIVAFTFTERAAQNMKNKIYEKMTRIDPELCNHLGKMYIGTIHAFSFQMLQDHFGCGNYDVLDENQEMAFMLRHGWDFGLGGKGYVSNCDNFLRSVSVVYDELIDNVTIKQKDTHFLKHFIEFEDLLNSHKLLTFSRMIPLLVQNLEKNNSSLNYIKHLIVDEYQDINKAQQTLIKIISQWANVYVVGDPRQCIYQWRGSDKSYFDNFENNIGKEELVYIKENRRSCKGIVENANKFSKTLKGQYEEMTPFRKSEGGVIKIEFENDENEAKIICEEIRKLIESGKCKYSDVAILFRSVKTSAKPFIEEFKKLNVPYIVGGKIGLFQRDEAQLVGRLFSWLSEDGFWIKNSYDWKNLIKGEALLTTSKELWKVVFKEINFPEDKLKQWKKEVLNESYKDLSEIFQELLVILGFLNLDQENKLDATVMANLGRFNSLLVDFQSSVLLGGHHFNWKRDLKSLNWFMNSYAYEAYEEQPAEDIRGVEAVQIMTVHQAKGLEWLTVFMPGLTNKRFPSTMMGKEQNWMISRDLFPVDRYEGNEDDERRLFYVAITRARDFLLLSNFKRMKNEMTESPFLRDLQLKSLTERVKILYPSIESVNNEEEIQTFAGGEIIDYNRCNYLYRLNTVWNYPSIFSQRLGFGKSLHHCLRRASELIKTKGMDPEKAIEKVFDDGEFHLPYAEKMQKEVMTRSAKKSLINYAQKHKKDMLNVEEVETRIEFPLEKATIAGRIDVLIGPKNSLEVRDYKTSDSIITNEEASLQVQVYTLGLKKIKDNIDKATIAYIKEVQEHAQIVPVEISKKKLEEVENNAKKSIDGIKKGVWKAKCGEHCEKCSFKKICKYTKIDRKLVVKI